MISYDLALKLKEAGFPQDVAEDFWSEYYDEEGHINSLSWLPDPLLGGLPGQPKPAGYFYKLPTLSELIEACGDNFAHLEKGAGKDSDKWFCNWSKSQGSTPEEAVANLYLALNTKS